MDIVEMGKMQGQSIKTAWQTAGFRKNNVLLLAKKKLWIIEGDFCCKCN